MNCGFQNYLFWKKLEKIQMPISEVNIQNYQKINKSFPEILKISGNFEIY